MVERALGDPGVGGHGLEARGRAGGGEAVDRGVQHAAPGLRPRRRRAWRGREGSHTQGYVKSALIAQPRAASVSLAGARRPQPSRGSGRHCEQTQNHHPSRRPRACPAAPPDPHRHARPRRPAAAGRLGVVLADDGLRGAQGPAEPRRPATGALDEIGSLGVHALRVVLYWHDVAPRAGQPRPSPTSTPPTRPATTGRATTRSSTRAKARGLERAAHDLRARAEVGHRAPPRTPSRGPTRRSSRSSSPPSGATTPTASRDWSIWNEPNQPQFLMPQYDARHRPVSPRLYRLLYRAALKGLHRRGRQGPDGADGRDLAESAPARSSPR